MPWCTTAVDNAVGQLTFCPCTHSTLVTLRISRAPCCCLAVIPPFHDAVDNAVGQLAQDGLLGVADFFVSGKYDTPMRQMHWGRRFFWRCADRVHSILLVSGSWLAAGCCWRLKRNRSTKLAATAVSSKYDTPMRQMHWECRFFWRWAQVVRFTA
jgi:hypothetical protein